MSKALKRFLVILMILIGAILAIPKSEKAGLYDDYFYDEVGNGHNVDFNNNGDIKWYCLQKEIKNVGFGTKKAVILLEYESDKDKYKITYDMGNGKKELGYSEKLHEVLQAIAKLAMQDQGDVECDDSAGPGINFRTPYKNLTQIALWYKLKQLGAPKTGDDYQRITLGSEGELGHYFGSADNLDGVDYGTWAWQAGISAYYISCTGSAVITKEIKSHEAYMLYDKIRDCKEISEGYAKSKKILMAIYEGNTEFQNLICVDLEPDNLNFNFEKVDENGNPLTGATVEVTLENVKGDDGKPFVSSVKNNGYLYIENMEPKDTTRPIVINVQETEAPNSDYELDNTKYKYVVKYNNSEGKWEIDKGSSTLGVYNLTGNTLKVTLKNHKKEIEPEFQFDLEKVDGDGNRINGAKFDVTITGIKSINGKNQSEYKGTDIEVNGIKSFTAIKQADNAQYITVTVKEKYAPDGYEIDPNEHTRYFRYSNKEWQYWENGSWEKCNGSRFTVQAVNEPIMEFDLEKVDGDGNRINGAKFDVTITGIKSINGKNQSEYKGTDIEVNGIKSFTAIKQADNAQYITVTVKEKYAPDGYEIDPNEHTRYFRYSNKEWQYWENGSWEKCNGSRFTVQAVNEPIMEFDLKKADKNGNLLSGAQFNVTITGIKNVTVDGANNSSYNNKTITVNETKEFTKIKQADNSECITVTVTETYAPNGYEKDPNTYTRYFRYNKGWESSVDKINWKKNTDNTFTIIAVNEPIMEFDLEKVDEIGRQIDGAKFDVKIDGIKNVTVDGQDYSNYNKNITVNKIKKFTNIKQADNAQYITVTVKETQAPSALFEKDPNTYTKYFRYNSQKKYWESSDDRINWSELKNSKITSTAKNNYKKIIINPITGTIKSTIDGYAWVDNQTGDKNALKGDGKYQNGESAAKGVKVTVEATIQKLSPTTKYANIYYIDGKYVVYYECNSQNEKKKDKNNNDVEPDASYAYQSTYSKDTSSTGTRIVTGTATTDDKGYYKVDNITLNNYTVNLDKVDGADATYNTGKHGPYYEYITKVKVTFTYNGAEYETTYDYTGKQPIYTAYKNSGNGSKLANNKVGLVNNAFEDAANRSRSNLETITLNKDTKNKEIPYKYNGTKAKTSSLDISNGDIAGYKDSYFAKNATTNDIATGFGISSSTQDIRNVCLALSPRTVDLALYMNVDHTDVSINGKTTTYTEPVINIDTNDEIKKWIESNANVDVNIYPTDYYYRIADYTNDNAEALKNSKKLDYGKAESDELDIKVTYKVTMLKQAITHGSSQINQLVYYYDSDKYTLDGIYNENGTKNNNYKNAGNAYSSINGYNAIVVNGAWNVDNANPTLFFTFTVNKDANGAIKTGKVKDNIVAITSYYTQYGFLDSDSSTKKDMNWEDDTSKAQSVTVNVTGEKRTISGNVFNDLNKNGMLNDGESINDVVVQLIEITKNNNEYIWQETVAGSKEVKSLVQKEPGDYKLYKYNVGDVGTGGYKFENVVPGSYIVRFIYGDGYNYDVNVNTTKYNGADYKSTKDPNYKQAMYNNTNYFGTGASVARDNEARRLEVIGATTEIDVGLGTALDVYAKNKQNLTSLERENILNYLNKLKDSNDNEFNAAINYLKTSKGNNSSWTTWRNNVLSNISNEDLLIVVKKLVAYKTFMTAETSKINMPVDTNSLKTTTAKSTIQHNKIDINFTNVNFGLMQKPEVKLELEKHITALKVIPNGTGVTPIIDAKADINKIINGTTVETTGIQTGLTKIKSTRNERGWWRVETDVEELSQGASLEVEYTYVVKNVGDEDYISKTLADVYKNNQSGYGEALKNQGSGLKNSLKGKTHTYGRFLGQYYYTGTKANTDVAVTSRVEELGEALNNQLRYEKETSGNDFTKENSGKVNKTIYDVDATPKTEQIETVVKTTHPTNFLITGKQNDGKWTANKDVDSNKKIKLTRVLSSLNSDDNGNIPSYIAQVLKYSSASGGRNKESIPDNLTYVHSKDTEKTMETDNEKDEFWGESIIITKPTGENKILPAQIEIAVAVSVAIIGLGIILIRKIVLTKKL